jgi:hypothetical protein
VSKFLRIENRIFREWRLRLYGSGTIVIFVVVLVWTVFVRHLWPLLPNGHPICVDFGWMWLSGKLAAAGDAARIFDYSAFSSAQLAFFGPENCIHFNRFYYPPTFLFFTYPLGFMPYLTALAVWLISSFVLYQATVYKIVSQPTMLIAAASPYSVMLLNVNFGHTGFLTAALVGLTLVSMERRPWLAGIFLGLLTYKPHLGLLFPIALLASRNWRVFGCTVLTTSVLAISAAIAFGYEGWTSFIGALTDRSSGLGPGGGVALRLQSVFGVLYWAGATTWIAWSAQLVVSAVVALAIWIFWAKPISYNLKAAALCAGSLLASPYALSYDLFILSIAAAFFVNEGLSQGFIAGERTAVFICWAALVFVKFTVGPVVCTVLLLLCLRRIVTYRRDRPAVLRDASIRLLSTGISG